MNLPNYFLADLPPEAILSPAILREAAETIRRNRDHYLATRSTGSMVELLSAVGQNWLDPDYPFRKFALKEGPAATGFSSPTLAKGLDTFFSQLTGQNLQALLEQELGNVRRLDEMTATSAEDRTHRAATATAPELIVHITAGNLPCSAWQSMVLGVLLRSAQFIKCASGASFLLRLFAHSLYEADKKLGASLELAEWRGGIVELENALFEHADCVTVTGSDETLTSLRQRLPLRARFVGYGHRVSFGYVTKNVLSGLNARKIVARAATDVVAWNQLGCLSPHIIYVESGAEMTAEEFAESLAEELAQRETMEPRGNVPTEVAATISSRRSVYEMRAAHSAQSVEIPRTRVWASPGSTAWTVVYEGDPRFQVSCLHRFIYVKSIGGQEELLKHFEEMRGKVSTVGLAATEERAQELATRFARWGVTRICPLGQMQNPPLAWRHDGRPALADLVQWTDWEMSPTV
jgi:hypothetical protein